MNFIACFFESWLKVNTKAIFVYEKRVLSVETAVVSSSCTVNSSYEAKQTTTTATSPLPIASQRIWQV